MSFEILAPHYRWLEFVLAGPKLQRCRTAFLDRVAHRHSVLILGEGNGRFLLECRRQLPQARITCLDASPRMLQLARQRLRRAGLDHAPVQFIHADALDCPLPNRAFDLIVTNFFLDCFRPRQLRRLIARLAAAAQPSASWLLADFRLPHAGLRRARARAIHWLMYRFFRIVTRLPARSLTHPDPFLQHHRFTLCQRRLADWDLLHADLWERPN